MALVAAICVVVWCSVYDRWTAENWNVPVEYGINPAAADVKAEFEAFRAAEDGKLFPGLFHYEPRLNAPYIANFNDFPFNEDFMFWAPGLLARVIGFYPAINCLVLFVQVLAALAFYYAARRLKCGWLWSGGAALLFALAPYAFAHSLHHVDIACYWHLPLCLLVCYWLAHGGGLRFGSRDYWLAIGVAVVTGLQNVYYLNAFLQLVAISLAVRWARHGWRRWRVCLPALSIGAAAFAPFFILAARVPIYALLHGHPSNAVVRSYAQMEFYGLKLIDMLIPFPTHKFAAFARLGRRYESISILPAETPPACYFGLVGIAALIWLGGCTVRNSIARPARKIPLESVQVVWLFLYGVVGGLNGYLGVMNFQLFRSTTRFCIVILAITLLFAIRRLSLISNRWPRPWPVLAPVAIAVFGLYEFLPATAGEDPRYVSAIVNSDRLFSEAMESALPKGGMVFQLPVMDFPESPIAGVSAYDHFRPYIYTHDLRFTFGTDKGRPVNAWQRVVAGMAPAQQIAALERYGFSGIYVNREGYADHGEALLSQYKAAGRTRIIESPIKDLFCVVLNPSPNPAPPPPGPFFSEGWYTEQDGANGQRANLSSGNASITLTNPSDQPVEKYANFYLGSLAPRTVILEGDGAYESWHVDSQQPAKVANLRLTLPPGTSKINFTTDAPGTPQQLGPVTFYIVNLTLDDSPRPEP